VLKQWILSPPLAKGGAKWLDLIGVIFRDSMSKSAFRYYSSQAMAKSAKTAAIKFMQKYVTGARRASAWRLIAPFGPEGLSASRWKSRENAIRDVPIVFKMAWSCGARKSILRLHVLA
jgi:hypothetical protein